MILLAECTLLPEAESIAEKYWSSVDRENLVPGEALSALRSIGAFSPGETGYYEILCAVRGAARFSPGIAHVILVNASAWLAAGGLASGLLAFSITEPGGGTDVLANLRTVAERRGESYFVSGEKVFTSNAPYADEFIVLALEEGEPRLFSVPRSDRVEYSLLEVTGLRGSGASRVVYRDAPATPVGERGEGLRRALQGINLGRLGYAFMALGIADRALQIMVDAASSKTIFGRKLIEYQGVRWRIAEIESARRALEALAARAAAGLEKGRLDPLDAAIAKNLGASLAQSAAWHASQILGGRGLALGSETERMMRDARVLDIGEGAREVLLDFIASRAIKSVSRGR